MYAPFLAIASCICLAIATLSATAVVHTNTLAWFIGGVFAFVLSVLFASYKTYGPRGNSPA